MASTRDSNTESTDKALVTEATTILAEIVRAGGHAHATTTLRAAEFVAKAVKHGHELPRAA